MSNEENHRKSSGSRYNFLNWTRWDFARFLVKLSLFAVFISTFWASISFWFIPKPLEYPGIPNGQFPNAAFRDISEKGFSTFLKNFIISSFIHIGLLGPIEILGWVLQVIAFTLTFMLILKIYDIIEKNVEELNYRQYLRLTMGSLFVGIILLNAGSRQLSPINKLYNAITMGVLTLIIIALERVRKSMIDIK